MNNLEEKRVEKLGKLLKQASDVAGTPEELVFREKAYRLMAKWGIESERVAQYLADENHNARVGNADYREVSIHGKWRAMQAMLLGSISEALHSYAVQSNGFRMTLVGMPDHISRVQELFEVAAADMIDAAEREGRQWKGILTPGRIRVFRKSFMIGYAMQLRDRLAQVEQEVARQAGALVLYKTDQERAHDKMLEVFPNVTIEQKGKNAQIDQIGFMLGQQHGDQVSLATHQL